MRWIVRSALNVLAALLAVERLEESPPLTSFMTWHRLMAGFNVYIERLET